MKQMMQKLQDKEVHYLPLPTKLKFMAMQRN